MTRGSRTAVIIAAVQSQFSVSLIIPMFNEEESIEHALAVGVAGLSANSDDWEIIVVDDASTDASPAMARAAAAADRRIRTIHHQKNLKLGGSLRSGFAAATKELILYMDCDLPYDLESSLRRAIAALRVSRADMIAAYRFDRTVEGFRRTMYSWIYNVLIGVLFGWPHRDINFSFKLMRRQVLEAMDLRSQGSLIDAELVIKARNLGFVIQQIGIDYFPRTRGTSTLSSMPVIVAICREMLQLHGDLRHPQRRTPQPVGSANSGA